jgi:GAF domain-containing protein
MAVDQEAFARSMRAMRKLDAATEGLVKALQHVSDAAKELFVVHGAGLMLLDEDGALRWVSVSDDGGRALEEAQQELEQGPSMDALELEGAVSTTDLLNDGRWPRLAQLLAEHKVRAVLSTPVRLRGHLTGTLNLLANTQRDWDDQDHDAAEAYAGVVGHLLDTAMEAERAEQLQHALGARILVEQAKGVLMERENLAPREAFERMRQLARSSRRRITEVAEEVLASATDTADAGEIAAEAVAAGDSQGEELGKARPDGEAAAERLAHAVTQLVEETPGATGDIK